MCSVIEIKNANEYYIHYHSPESLNPNEEDPGSNKNNNNKQNNKNKGHMESVQEGNMSTNEVDTTSTKLKSAKDQEVTSDRGSSASPSLEDEDEQQQQQQQNSVEKLPERQKRNSTSPAKESKIPVLRSSKKGQAPQPPTSNNGKKSSSPDNKAKQSKPDDTKNPFLNGSKENSPTPQPPSKPNQNQKAASDTKKKGKDQKTSFLPRPSPSKAKMTPARSCESVPITVNSHIPASPMRPMSTASSSVANLKKVTSEMGTQVEDHNQPHQNGIVTKSVSVENLSSPVSRKASIGLLQGSKKSSESSDPICGSPVKKWSYTNGRMLPPFDLYSIT